MMQYFWLLLCFYLPLFIMMYACVYMRGEGKGVGGIVQDKFKFFVRRYCFKSRA